MSATMKKTDLRDLSLVETEDFAGNLGLEKDRGRQIFHWTYGKAVASIDEMTELSKEVRGLLSQRAYISRIIEAKRQHSIDGTEKFLFALEDGHRIENVLTREEYRLTLSTLTRFRPVLACVFSVTGKGGLVR